VTGLLLPEADPLLLLAVILIAGTTLGWLAQRIHLPSVSGQILAGVLVGPSVLGFFNEHSTASLQPLTHFALALIGVTVGAHLNLRRLRNAKRRLTWIGLAELTFVPLLVCGGLIVLTGADLTLGVLLGTLAVSTAPATTIALVRETRSTGVFVKTLVAAVAINNFTCIFLFELARSLLSQDTLGEAFGIAAIQMGQAVAIGASLALATHLLTLRVHSPDRLTTVSVISLLLTFGLSSYAGVSPLLACLTLGMVQTNIAPSRDRLVDSVFENFEPVVLCVFFTLAGSHLSFDHAWQAGWIALVFIGARVGAKLLSGRVAMSLAGATARVRQNLGLALLPQAGVAVGLVILIQGDPAFADIGEIFTAVVLTAVTANEIIGPLTTRLALSRSGELGLDRPRLVDFLQEENILVGMKAETMEDAIGQLVDLLIRSHGLMGVDREELLASVLTREAAVSTCLGRGLAVPHGELRHSDQMLGVMGLSSEGLGVSTPDNDPLHCVVLLATPAGERDRHLEVLAALARTIGADPLVQQQLYFAGSSAHAYEILHGEDTVDFNYFLDALPTAPLVPGQPG
jgi:Kef-type K+ transport system membrane component KefB/mannitol/fructose-specific phosphotransferase system IIA component (Ntr-type)